MMTRNTIYLEILYISLKEAMKMKNFHHLSIKQMEIIAMNKNSYEKKSQIFSLSVS